MALVDEANNCMRSGKQVRPLPKEERVNIREITVTSICKLLLLF